MNQTDKSTYVKGAGILKEKAAHKIGEHFAEHVFKALGTAAGWALMSHYGVERGTIALTLLVLLAALFGHTYWRSRQEQRQAEEAKAREAKEREDYQNTHAPEPGKPFP